MDEPMSQEEYDQLISLGYSNADLQAAIEYQKMIADKLRRDAPQGHMAGRVYVAPSALEYLGNFAQNAVSGNASNKARQQQQEMNANTNQQNMMIQRALLRQPAQQPMPMVPQGAQSNPFDTQPNPFVQTYPVR